jgi:hypothetical protein
MESSIIYSMGTALNLARNNDTPVEVLVGSQWIVGRVLTCDGHGVVLETDRHEHAVIRMESVSAVKILSRVPQEAAPRPAACVTAHAVPAQPVYA